MTQLANTNAPEKRRVQPRVVLLLAGLAAVISASVIATDSLSRTSGPRSHASTAPEKGTPQ